MMEHYQKLFEPFQLGTLQLRNRVMMTSMSTGFADRGGLVTQKLIDYYGARAAGGAALITVEMVDLHPQLIHVRKGLLLTGEHQIPGLRRLTDRIHREGARASVQIGGFFRPGSTGLIRYSTDEITPEGEPSLAMNKEEMSFFTSMLVRGAQRLRDAGFDAVEIHAVHGSLLSEFLSPYWNKRTDEYGGSPENRVRFLVEIARALRKTMGEEFPILFRISSSEFTDKGYQTDDGAMYAQALESAGVTAISLSGGLGHIDHIGISPSYIPRGILLEGSGIIKKAVKIPVIVANGLTPETAEQALAEGKADLIGLGRPLIADPEWPNKVREGRVFRPCIRCVQACIGSLRDIRNECIDCIYNTSVGREGTNELAQTETPKKVVVIGGGPAGCETARVCALRGHQVTLIEKEKELGGQFRLAALPPGKADFLLMFRYYQDILKELGVDVRYNITADAAFLKELDADVYVLAAGSTPSIPPLEGKELPKVSTAHAYLSGELEIEEGPVVIIGGGATGLETAHMFVEKGIDVSVVESLNAVGRELTASVGPKEYLLEDLQAKGCKFYTSSRAVRITEEALIVSDRPLIGGGKETSIPARWILFAAGMRPRRSLLNEETAKLGRWLAVGDCENPGNAYHAIHDAYRLALTI
ncbi:MAG: FAD-dependent oxidoreductase [Clostridium sp.]|nr:FAD-dependent oxidoreductase [Clostridium sp.]